MQALFILLTVACLAVAVFALQNAEPVTVRFLYWQRQSSVALVTLAAVTTGALIAWLLGLTARLVRWRRRRPPRPAPTVRPMSPGP